jgi:sugar phosphate isomerase/epimerase
MTERRIAVSEITTAGWSFEEDVEAYGETPGVEGIGVWRDKLADSGLDAATAADRIDDGGIEACSLIFAGGFTDPEEFDEQVEDGRRAIEDAATLNAPVLLVIAGPRLGIAPAEGDRMVREALEALAPAARDAGVTLALEPLHPVDATRFSTVVRLDQALDVVDGIEGVGVFFDTWNTWWDPSVGAAIDRAGDAIAGVHVADWRHPSEDPRDRAPPGEGVAPVADLLDRVEAAGYEGWYEVELFTEQYGPEEYPALLEACVEGARDVLPGGSGGGRGAAEDRDGGGEFGGGD